MKQRVVLWGALVVLVGGAVGLVAANRGGEGGDAPALPLSVGSDQGTGDGRAASAAVLELVSQTTYVAGDGLPAGGGAEPAYRLAGSVDGAAVRDLAAALGIEGEPAEQDGSWRLAGGELTLDVHGPGAAWTAHRSVDGGDCVQRGDVTECTVESSASASASASASGSASGPASGSGSASGSASGPASGSGSASGSASASAGVAVACPTDPAVQCPDPRTPERPADLPSEDEARRIALDLLGAAGIEVEGADVRVTDGVTQWVVAVEPRLGGLPAPGLAGFVAVGAGGRIESAWGHLGTPDELGDYDLIDTRAALDRLNGGEWGTSTAGAAVEGPIAESGTGSVSASPETTIAPGAVSGAGGAAGADPSGPDQPRTLPAPAEAAPGSAPTSSTTGTVPPTTGTVPPTTGTVPPTITADGGSGGSGSSGSSGSGSQIASGSGQIAPGEPAPGGPAPAPQPAPAPAPEPDPVEVAVTDAEVVLIAVPSWDDTGTYLVPGYRFTAEDGSDPMVPAVADDVLAPAPGGNDEAPGGQAEPGAEAEAAPAEPRPATPETTVPQGQPDPAGREVDIALWHCGIEPLEVDGQRWVADPPPFDETTAPPELAGHGTFTVATDGGSATYTDDSGITVDLVPVGEDWQPPPCD